MISMKNIQERQPILLMLSVSIVFLLWSRLFLLHIIPSTIPHDELVYAVQAASYALQGTTIDQLHHWWQLTPFDPMYAELPATLMSIGFLFSKNALLGSHLTSAIMGITLPFFLAWLAYNLWSHKGVAISIFVLAVFNPLLWQFSRFGYDAFYSLWFFVFGAACLTRPKFKISIWSVPILFIGFFNYQGMKLLMVPWMTLIIALLIISNLKNSQLPSTIKQWVQIFKTYRFQLLVLSAAVILTLIYGLVVLPSQSQVSERLNTTLFSETPQIARSVDEQRRLSIVNPLSSLFSNKITETVHFVLGRLLSAFNPIMLFMMIEPGVSGFSVWIHGLFYWIEGLLILLGSFLLLKNRSQRITGMLLLLGSLVLSFPTLINTGSEWHLLRTMLSYVTLLFIAAWGLNWVMHLQRMKWIFLVIYLISIMQFTYIYFFRFPIISLDWGNFYERQAAHYVALASRQYPEKKIAVHAAQSDYYFWAYLIYSGELNWQNRNEISQVVRTSAKENQRKFFYKNLIFTPDCYDPQASDPQLVEITIQPCVRNEQGDLESVEDNRDSNSFVQVKDSGLKLRIYNDLLCQNIQLNTYIHLANFSQLDIEKMDQTKFCQTWVTAQ